MKLVWIAIAAIGAVSSAAHAVPPVATHSPGYEARLQESRRGSATTTFTPAPRPAKPKPKKPQQQ